MYLCVCVGKGRTGTMIACYLLFAGICETPLQALDRFAGERTTDGKVLIIFFIFFYFFLFFFIFFYFFLFFNFIFGRV